jgi:predicted rRNA methylase YqxC with S4 and FtsJ domains
VRLDKWLWAARFFKTRSLAQEAVAAVRVKLNSERTKRAHGEHVVFLFSSRTARRLSEAPIEKSIR